MALINFSNTRSFFYHFLFHKKVENIPREVDKSIWISDIKTELSYSVKAWTSAMLHNNCRKHLPAKIE